MNTLVVINRVSLTHGEKNYEFLGENKLIKKKKGREPVHAVTS